MTDYLFDQIDPAHPPLLDPLGDPDRVLFHGGPARLASVVYSAVNGQSITTVGFLGHAVGFDPGIQRVAANHNLIFDDGSNLLIGGPRDEAITGSARDDALYGGDGADTLDGLAGDNFIHGNQGNDRLIAGAGADTVLGGQGDDFIRAAPELAGEAGNFVHGNLGNDTIAGGDGADILLGGQGNDVVFAGHGLDTLHGDLGDDHLVAFGAVTAMFGDAGADTLEAGAADCFLIGGAGADLYQIDLAPVASPLLFRESILDWDPEDRLLFAGLRPDHAYGEATVQDEALAIATANALLRANGGGVLAIEIRGEVLVFADTFGDANADAVVRLVGRTLSDISADDIG